MVPRTGEAVAVMICKYKLQDTDLRIAYDRRIRVHLHAFPYLGRAGSEQTALARDLYRAYTAMCLYPLIRVKAQMWYIDTDLCSGLQDLRSLRH